MKIIVEVRSRSRGLDEEIRFFRVSVPDGSKITWQGSNPTKHDSDCVLRVYSDAGKKDQIMAIPSVLSWRRDDIAVEEFKPVRRGIGKYWEDLKDGPMFEGKTGPVPTDRNMITQAGATAI